MSSVGPILTVAAIMGCFALICRYQNGGCFSWSVSREGCGQVVNFHRLDV